MSDCMTQEDAEKMDNRQAVEILKPLRDMMRDQHGCPISDAFFALNKAIEALSAQPEQDGKVSFWKERAKEYEDIILRFATEKAKGIKLDSIEITGERIIFKNSQPERKRGKWIKGGDNSYRCSVCDEVSCCMGNYCPDCGADMRGEEYE